MNRQSVSFLSALFITASLQAGSFSSSAKGTTAAGFLKVGVGARASSMGDAYAAVADDAGALYWNPAGLRKMGRRSALVMRATYLDQGALDYGAYGQAWGERSAWGMSFQRASAGDVTRRDENGNSSGSFVPQDTAVTIGVARSFPGLTLGMSGKLIESTLLDTARTAAVDLGLLTDPLLNGKLTLAFTATNLGGKITYGQKAQDLPSALRAGAALKLADRWTAALDVAAPRDDAPFACLGTELAVPLGGAWNLSWRAGYNTQAADAGGSGMNGFSFGFGMGFRSMGLDYSSLPMGPLGSAHRFSLAYKF